MRYRTVLVGLAMVLSLCFPRCQLRRRNMTAGFSVSVADWHCRCQLRRVPRQLGAAENSLALYFKGGGAVNPHVLIGGQFNLWAKDETGVFGAESTIKMYNLMGTVTFYPQTEGFFVNLGAGLSFVGVDSTVSNTTLSTDLGKGFGFLLGTGYDIRVGQHLAVTPAVQDRYGAPGDPDFAGGTILHDWKQNVVDFTIGLTIF